MLDVLLMAEKHLPPAPADFFHVAYDAFDSWRIHVYEADPPSGSRFRHLFTVNEEDLPAAIVMPKLNTATFRLKASILMRRRGSGRLMEPVSVAEILAVKDE